MTKKDHAFKLFEEGASPDEIAKKLGIKREQVAGYKFMWKKAKGTVTADDLADSLFGPDEEEVEEAPQKPTINTEFEKAFTEIEVQAKMELQPTFKGKWLVEKSRLITYKGEYGAYGVINALVDVHFDTPEMTLDKKALSGLIEELQELYQII